MPYINKNSRDFLDYIIDDLIGAFNQHDISRDGSLNYVISSVINNLYDTNYTDLNAAIGVLECAKMELYRRVVAPYEDTKIIENGDVYT